MKFDLFKTAYDLQRIDHLIRTAATGSPKSLADRLGISECSVYRLIDDLKEQGFPIEYDKCRQTYRYAAPVEWRIELVTNGEKHLSIKGGKKNFDFFSKLANFDSEGPHLCDAFQIYGAQ
jgi:biotin operon repressor